MMAAETKMTEPQDASSSIRALIGLLIGLVAAIFCAGVAEGFLAAMSEDGSPPISPRFGGVTVGTFITTVTLLLTVPYLPKWRTMSPRRRLYWGSLAGSALLGGVIALLLITDGEAARSAPKLLSNLPLNPDFALAASALWFIGIGAACIAYHRAIDDHEERAWLWAGLAGWYAFVLPAPAWWVLHRAAVAPPVDVMVLFIVSMLVNAIVWLWLKFR